MATQTVPRVRVGTERKVLVRRTVTDRSQRIRHIVQVAFVALNGWLGVQFYFWVRYFERGGTGYYVLRPAGIEGWLPIAGLMNTKYFLMTGHVPAIHAAAMFLFMAFVLMSLLLKKAFCSWLCPVGTLSEFLWMLGQKIFGCNVRVPRWADIPLRGLKYLLLGFFGYFIALMSTETMEGFLNTPYGLLADVKMLDFFRNIGETGAIVIGLLVLGSLLVKNFWCRYLCPYGALIGLVSLLSPVKIRRDAALIVRSVRRRARPDWQWTSSCRFGQWSARRAWRALRLVLRRMLCNWHSLRDGLRRQDSAGGCGR